MLRGMGEERNCCMDVYDAWRICALEQLNFNLCVCCFGVYINNINYFINFFWKKMIIC